MTWTPQGNTNLTPEVLYGGTSTLILWPKVNGEIVTTPTSLRITIRKPGGAATSITSAVATLHADGYLYYTLDASTTADWPLGSDYWADWTFTANGISETVATLFDIVLRPLNRYIPITINDLKGVDPLIDSVQTNVGDTDAKFTKRFVIPAWEDVINWLRSKESPGPRPYLLADARVLYSVTKYRALQLLCRGIERRGNGRWQELEAKYAKDFETAKKQTTLRYTDEATRSVSVDRAFRQPDVSTGGTDRGTPNYSEYYWRDLALRTAR